MVYILNYNGKKYNLAEYKLNVAAAYNAFCEKAASSTEFGEKYKNTLCALTVALGKDKMKEIFPDIDNQDVNDVFILAEEVRNVYEHPLSAYKKQKITDLIKATLKNTDTDKLQNNNT